MSTTTTTVIRRLLQLHGLCDEHGNRTMELKPEFADPLNQYPWTSESYASAIGRRATERRCRTSVMVAGGAA